MLLGANKKYFSIDLDDGFMQTRWQSIIWTNDGEITDIYVCHSASMS